MSTDHERHLLGRARELADLGEMAETVTGILGGARRAGLDLAALTGLVGAASALGAQGTVIYRAGRGPGPRHADENEFLTAIADAEDDMNERLRAAGELHDRAVTAMDDALGALDAARAMYTREPCDGCHGRKAAAIADAEARIGLCEDAIEVLEPLAVRLRHALARIGAVPSGLGETYEAVYTLIRRGGRMPRQGRWITGEAGHAPERRAAPAVTVQDRIRAAFGELAGTAPATGLHLQGWLSIRRLRERLADVPRAELDSVLTGMYLDQEINMVPSSNQDSRVLTGADRAAAVSCGGEDKHLFCVN